MIVTELRADETNKEGITSSDCCTTHLVYSTTLRSKQETPSFYHNICLTNSVLSV